MRRFSEEGEAMYAEDTEKVCGDCNYHVYDRDKDDWDCNNYDSENYGLFTAYGDGCEEWEERT